MISLNYIVWILQGLLLIHNYPNSSLTIYQAMLNKIQKEQAIFSLPDQELGFIIFKVKTQIFHQFFCSYVCGISSMSTLSPSKSRNTFSSSDNSWRKFWLWKTKPQVEILSWSFIKRVGRFASKLRLLPQQPLQDIQMKSVALPGFGQYLIQSHSSFMPLNQNGSPKVKSGMFP